MNIETHPLAPFLPHNARFLLLGSFPPPKQRWKMDFYYPNYNNDMWRIMGVIFYGDKDYFIDIQHKNFKQNKIEQFLQQQGIAISDTVYQAIRLKDNASDKFLQVVQEQDIAQLLAQIPHCQHILTTGEKATETLLTHYALSKENVGVQLPKIGQSVDLLIDNRKIKLHRLPSSSRAYPLALEQKASYYQAVLKL